MENKKEEYEEREEQKEDEIEVMKMYGEWRYSYMPHYPRYSIEVNGQLHASAALS
jgi:hypothetical protein